MPCGVQGTAGGTEECPANEVGSGSGQNRKISAGRDSKGDGRTHKVEATAWPSEGGAAWSGRGQSRKFKVMSALGMRRKHRAGCSSWGEQIHSDVPRAGGAACGPRIPHSLRLGLQVLLSQTASLPSRTNPSGRDQTILRDTGVGVASPPSPAPTHRGRRPSSRPATRASSAFSELLHRLRRQLHLLHPAPQTLSGPPPR